MLDVIRVVIHRLRNGKNPFLPDRNHIHHKFIALGMSQRKAMVSIVIMAALLHWEIVFDSLPFRNKLVSVGCGCLDGDSLLHNYENQAKT